MLGVSYKARMGDTRESPALKIIELLRARGGDVTYHDPHVPQLPSTTCAAPGWTRRSPAPTSP